MAAIKLVIAVVKPFKLDSVVDALKGAGVESMTVAEVKDFGRKGPTEIYRGAQYTASFLPMARIEAAVASDQVATVTAVVATAGETGRAGDCKLFVIDAEDAARLRPSEPTGIMPRQAA